MKKYLPVRVQKILLLPALFLSLLLVGFQQANDNENRADSKVAKNVILFIGDGMGISTITAGRIFDGQSKGKTGEEHQLAFETFDHLALVKTYNADAQVPDSAGTATAIMSGYKANIGTINVTPENLYGGCGKNKATPTLAEITHKAGKAVGIVTTTRITDATPAAMYAHTAFRDWESDKDLGKIAQEMDCKSIAAQLVNPATPVDITLGGGLKKFTNKQIDAWLDNGGDRVLVKNRAEFKALTGANGNNVLGLFSGSHMSYEADRDPEQEPSLAEMTAFAIENLSARRSDGYVLMVEAGRIDHAHHDSDAYRALRDVQALNEAVKVALEKAGDDTLILVTADHSHVFTMAGYPRRGNPILGLVVPPDSYAELYGNGERYSLADDGKPYTTLGYHNGINPRHPDSPSLTNDVVQSADYHQQSAVPMQWETHGGEDVALFARGPGAERVKGVMEQDRIHNVILEALGVTNK